MRLKDACPGGVRGWGYVIIMADLNFFVLFD